MESVQPDLEIETIKTKSRQTWTAGDYGKIAKSIEAAAEEFVARRGITPGMRVLDVACGNGNVAIPAARAGAEVIGIDIAPNLIEQAKQRALQASLEVTFEVGDVEDLPYRDAQFDLVLTMFGAMFAPRPGKAAAEMLRVCRAGGTLAMANWTPTGFAGQMFRLVGGYVPPPQVPAPTLWGEEQVVRERLHEGTARIDATLANAEIRYPFPPQDVVNYFRDFFGPVRNAFAALPEVKQAMLERDLVAHWTRHNRAADGTTLVSAEYLEVVAIRG